MRLSKPSVKDVVGFIVDLVLNLGVYVVVLGIAALFSWAINNGYWPRDAEWEPCTTASSAHYPCVMDDGKLLVVHNGQAFVYPWKGE